jgi:hypothetical protein
MRVRLAVMGPPEPTHRDDPDSPVSIPHTVVARVRVPLRLVFDLIRAVHASMERYESVWGEIRRPEQERGEDG